MDARIKHAISHFHDMVWTTLKDSNVHLQVFFFRFPNLFLFLQIANKLINLKKKTLKMDITVFQKVAKFLKINFLYSHLDFIPDKLGAVIDEQHKMLH
jgi:hypothetical protein